MNSIRWRVKNCTAINNNITYTSNRVDNSVLVKNSASCKISFNVLYCLRHIHQKRSYLLSQLEPNDLSKCTAALAKLVLIFLVSFIDISKKCNFICKYFSFLAIGLIEIDFSSMGRIIDALRPYDKRKEFSRYISKNHLSSLIKRIHYPFT